MWYWGNNQLWTDWNEFKEDFLSNRYFDLREDKIRQGQQQNHEPLKDFVLELQTMLRNSTPDVKLFMKRNEFRTLVELVRAAVDLELTRAEEGARKPTFHREITDSFTDQLRTIDCCGRSETDTGKGPNAG